MKKTLYIVIVLMVLVLAVFIFSFFFQKDILPSITFGALEYPVFNVDGESRNLSELKSNTNASLKFYEESSKSNPDLEKKDEKTIKQEVLQTMIENALAEKLAKDSGINFSDSEIQSELDIVINQVGDENQLKSNLEKMFGWTIDDFKNNIVKDQIIQQKLKEHISSSEDLNREQINKANDILQKVKSGESFEDLAKQFSDCPSKEQGGDLGFFSKASDDSNNKYPHMVSAFEQASFMLEPGRISDVVKTEFGWHIIKLEEKKTDENGILTVRARHILIKPAVDFTAWFNEKKNSAKVKIYLYGYKWKEGKVEIK